MFSCHTREREKPPARHGSGPDVMGMRASGCGKARNTKGSFHQDACDTMGRIAVNHIMFVVSFLVPLGETVPSVIPRFCPIAFCTSGVQVKHVMSHAGLRRLHGSEPPNIQQGPHAPCCRLLLFAASTQKVMGHRGPSEWEHGRRPLYKNTNQNL